MNYLAHLYLCDDNDWVRLGSLMGDFVKGRLKGKYPPLVEKGIRQHRHVDRFARDNPFFQSSWQRIDPSLKYIRPMLVDIFYDHFLAKNWDMLTHTPITEFSRRTYRIVEENMAILPDKMKPVVRRMIDYDWLTSYADIDTIDKVLERMSLRFRKKKLDLTPGSKELRIHYVDLETDCMAFLRQARTGIVGKSDNTL